MLDNVLEYFVENAPDSISRAKYSAERERSIGLGAMGFHSLLQRQGVAWESELAREINEVVFGTIKERATKQSEKLAKERGEYPDGKGSGMRNAHLLAIAPNASSGVILSTSPSIEPQKANAYTHRTRAGSFLVKNKYLVPVLEKYEINNETIWTSIITNKGSVQHNQLTYFFLPVHKNPMLIKHILRHGKKALKDYIIFVQRQNKEQKLFQIKWNELYLPVI